MNKKKVILGMSGGTDSSMAAILLKEAGYEVIGVTFVFHGDGGQHLQDAKELAQRLNIKHITHDAIDVFDKQIIQYFVTEYFAGRTPVPCVICNNLMKWPLLAQIADEQDAYYIATGHYVQTTYIDDRIYIIPGTDPDKDQSFFLWGLPPSLLERMLLPLGAKHKEEVRKMAAEKGYKQVSVKKDSLGVCFCSGDYRDFLRQFGQSKDIESGHFVDTQGRILGRHEGFPYYTVGQRRGLGINLNQALFVKEINAHDNRIVLAPHKDLYKTQISLQQVHVNYPNELEQELICRIRYRKQQTPCRVDLHPNNQAVVTLLEPLDSIAPGQSAVFYKDNRVIGGGIIEKAD